MNLIEYHRKRNFNSTPEPAGEETESSPGLRFVVQKHHASRLHYDFRLEMGGALKSWAVPKGPSLNPSDKRLAMMVEDHPLEYADFEGVIPAGNYGAGTVMVWDRGTYEPPADKGIEDSESFFRQEVHKGHLSFVLHGQKLKGEFSLVKMADRGENAWLLIKKSDEHATGEDVLFRDRSVLSGRSMEEIAASKKRWHGKDSPFDFTGAVRAEMPHGVSPMLATEADAPFDREGWLFEIKWDGYRAIAEVSDQGIEIYSRRQQSFNKDFPAVISALEQLEHEAVLDGEVVVLDEAGRSHFQLLQNYKRTRVAEGRLVYYVFDLLWLDGYDLRSLPLRQRKQMLKEMLQGQADVRYSDHIEGAGVKFYEMVREQGLEGVLAKNAESPYREAKRTRDWLKVKTCLRQEAVIAGYTEPKGGRKYFGAVILGVYDKDGELVYVGHTGGGFSDRSLKEVHEKLQPLIQEKPPFTIPPKTNAPATWVKPQLVCEVKFQEWTDGGHMRKPIFLGMREDKDPGHVHWEMPKPLDEILPETELAAEPGMPGTRVKLTNLDKTYWPREGYTKGDLLEYYSNISSVILPYLTDRPESLHRHPDGIEGESFFQKNVDVAPAWVKTIPIRSESEGREINYLVCQDIDTLLYIANMGCIEINPWNSRHTSLDSPDYLVVDLDPEGISFDAVIETALKTKEVLDNIQVPNYCKTSGATGLHIYVPLGAKYTYKQARDFTHVVVSLVHQALPDTTSLERMPDKRQNRVYLDYLQNRRAQTLAAPYSVRPRPGAPVSAPLQWSEVKTGLNPASFTIRTIGERLERLGDLWQPVVGPGMDMSKALAKLAETMA